jgi:microcystin-dependent protein
MSTLNVAQIKNPSAGAAAITLDTSGNAAAPSLVPPGTVQFYAASTAPAGWVKANGAALSRTAYATLFAAIGTTYGAGDGSTTFNAPDLRGEFPRGWDDGRGVDSARAIGTAQAAAFASHTHNVAGVATGLSADGANSGGAVGVFNVTGTSTLTSTSAGDTETRPRNIALLAIIKF